MSVSGVQWWCSAAGGAWTWTWRPYPGVWLFVAAIATAYVLRWRAHARRGHAAGDGARRLSAAAGLLLVWAALDWPVGPLGAGYLELAHAAQFVVIVMLAPPLLLCGLPPAAGRSRGPSLRRLLSRPLIAAPLSGALVVAGHAPALVDRLMASQVGALALDLGWVAAGVVLWWPLLSRRQEERLSSGPESLIYLLAAMLPDKAIGIWLLLSRWPVYRTYELAQPVWRLDARADQALGAGLMLGAGMVVMFVAVAVLVQRWVAAERALSVSAAPR